MSKKEINKIVENRARVNITMSKDMVDFYQKMSEEMGLARSACMVMGLKTYMDQQQMLVLGREMTGYTKGDLIPKI